MTARKPAAEKAPDPDPTEPTELQAVAPDAGGLPPAVFLIHPTRGHVVHVPESVAIDNGWTGWTAATPAQIKAAGLSA